MNRKAICVLAGNSFGYWMAGCRVHVDKDANGKEKNVQVDTPFGGVHVNTDQISAADLGLPVYPGAEIVRDKEHDKSADVNMGFGEWTLRVRAVNYCDRRFTGQGDGVLQEGSGTVWRRNHVPGKFTRWHASLNVRRPELHDSGNHGNVKIDDKDFGVHGGLQLKAGSKRHQHIVGFRRSLERQDPIRSDRA